MNATIPLLPLRLLGEVKIRRLILIILGPCHRIRCLLKPQTGGPNLSFPKHPNADCNIHTSNIRIFEFHRVEMPFTATGISIRTAARQDRTTFAIWESLHVIS